VILGVFAVAAATALGGRIPGAGAANSTLQFGNYRWSVKTSSSLVGPGPNYFAGANATVDSAGRLHLRIAKDSSGRWRSAEIINTRPLGYGTYRFSVASDLGNLDPNVILGLFTWDDAAAYNHREIDVEMAKWGNPAELLNAQFVVQPHATATNMVRFHQPPNLANEFEFVWAPGKVDFKALAGPTVVKTWSLTGADVPPPGNERAHLNLWLMNGTAPANGQPVDVVVSNFRFCTPTGICN
jgi:hypothetical protein